MRTEEQLKELDRLAEIGKATEIMFENGYILAQSCGRYAEMYDICTIKDLLEESNDN